MLDKEHSVIPKAARERLERKTGDVKRVGDQQGTDAHGGHSGRRS